MIAYVVLPLEREFFGAHKDRKGRLRHPFVVAEQLTVSRHVQTHEGVGVGGVPSTVEKHQTVRRSKRARRRNVGIVNREVAISNVQVGTPNPGS